MGNLTREAKIKKNVSNLIRSGILFPNRTEGEKFIGYIFQTINKKTNFAFVIKGMNLYE